MSAVESGVQPLPPGSEPGVRARVREYRLGLVRQAIATAKGPLRYEDVAAIVRRIDGVGIPLRTLKEPPFAQIISAQVRRPGRRAQLSGLPWRLTRLSPDRIAERTAEVETRLEAMRIDVPVPVEWSDDTDDLHGRIQRLWDMERAMSRSERDHGLAIAGRMKALLVQRRTDVAARRQLALSQAYHELRVQVRSGPIG